jgi:hypothetical protein
VVAHRDHTQASIRLLRRSFESDAYIEALMMQHPNGQVLRVKDNQLFVLYAAGVLASQLSILPFSEQQVREAAIHILKLWIEERDGIGAQEDHEAQEMIRGFIQMNEHRFIRIEEGDDGQETRMQNHTNNPVGYYLKRKGIYAIFPTAWEKEACAGLDKRQVAHKLFHQNYLDAETTNKGGVRKFRKAVKYIVVEGKREGLYCVRDSIRGEIPKDKPITEFVEEQ